MSAEIRARYAAMQSKMTYFKDVVNDCCIGAETQLESIASKHPQIKDEVDYKDAIHNLKYVRAFMEEIM